ncbi:MAG: helix-turn-helix domain-containing protein [Bacillota bacterium]
MDIGIFLIQAGALQTIPVNLVPEWCSCLTLAGLIAALATERELETTIAEQMASVRFVWNSSDSVPELPFAQNPAVSKVLSFLHFKSSVQLDLRQAAALAGMSPSHLSRVFSRYMGMPFVKYCNVVKVARTKTLLASTDLTVKEIAYQVGFDSAAYFGRVFHDLEGKTPSKFRKSVRSTAKQKVINYD